MDADDFHSSRVSLQCRASSSASGMPTPWKAVIAESRLPLPLRRPRAARKKLNMALSTLVRTGSSVRGEAMTSSHQFEVLAQGVTHEFPSTPDQSVCDASVDDLNQLLADTITLCDMYKKHHWRVSGPAYYPMYLLLDRHFAGQFELVDQLVERIKVLGGVASAMAREVVANTHIPAFPNGREDPTAEISRLLHAHEIILEESRAMAREASARGDDDTAKLIITNVIRTNDLQVMFLHVYLAQDDL
jgi:starvation-inducible DNA-binding protein